MPRPWGVRRKQSDLPDLPGSGPEQWLTQSGRWSADLTFAHRMTRSEARAVAKEKRREPSDAHVDHIRAAQIVE